tara:strand:+ start:1318 stop:1515 length:198 start_codon:yes stop_codon:yes gene_type:complete
MHLTDKQIKRANATLDEVDVKWILKTIFESHAIWGSDIEQSVITINKLKNKLKEIQKNDKSIEIK